MSSVTHTPSRSRFSVILAEIFPEEGRRFSWDPRL